jgi:hypothetical protein
MAWKDLKLDVEVPIQFLLGAAKTSEQQQHSRWWRRRNYKLII